jgi:hypothetical protein
VIYEGPHYVWTMNQTAIAAAKYPDYPPTQDGVGMLQHRWSVAGDGPLSNRIQEPRDLAWAKEAFADIRRRNPQLRYEQVPA